MSEHESPAQDSFRGLRGLFLRPGTGPVPEKPSTEDLRGLSRRERRRARLDYEAAKGRFHTWVYAVALIIMVGAFVWFILTAG